MCAHIGDDRCVQGSGIFTHTNGYDCRVHLCLWRQTLNTVFPLTLLSFLMFMIQQLHCKPTLVFKTCFFNLSVSSVRRRLCLRRSAFSRISIGSLFWALATQRRVQKVPLYVGVCVLNLLCTPLAFRAFSKAVRMSHDPGVDGACRTNTFVLSVKLFSH